jgi:hypothetical protein
VLQLLATYPRSARAVRSRVVLLSDIPDELRGVLVSVEVL